MESMSLPELQRFPSDAPHAEMMAAYKADGGMIIENMVPAETISALRDAADLVSAELVPGSTTQGMGKDGKEFVGKNTIRFSSLGLHTPAYFDLLDNEIFKAVADEVLLPNCGSYWVNTAQVMYIGPGEPAQVLHRDANNWWQYVSATWPNSAEVTVSAMIGLEDVTEHLGATRVVPRSNFETDLVHYDAPRETVPAELGAGDALIYSGYVVHGGGANTTTDMWRKAMHLSFVVGWLTPEEACAIDYTTEELQALSPRVQRLLGHRSYDSRPLRGGGLWLKNVNAIEDPDGTAN